MYEDKNFHIAKKENFLAPMTKTAREHIIDCHVSSLREGLTTILSGCTKSNSIESDANILKIREYSEGVVDQYKTIWNQVADQIETIHFPDMITAVSIDRSKYDKVKGLERAIRDTSGVKISTRQTSY
jgi:esterase/lipase